MNDSRIASRYARALYSLAKSKDRVEPVKADLDQLTGLLGESAEFRMMLESPILQGSEKVRIIPALFKGKLEEITLTFLILLVEHKREVFLSSICRMFMRLYKTEKGVLEARVESAQVFNAELLESLLSRLEKSTGKKIDLTSTMDADLIGGFKLTLEDQQLDLSVKSQLKKIKNELRESKK